MPETIAVVLDANVLYSGTLRGLFLWLASFRLFQPVWSREIWDEVIRNQSSDNAEREKFKAAVDNILSKFPQAMRELPEGVKPRGLPDPDDEHVLELAIRERARLIVTFNLRDFPEAVAALYETKCISPDEFLCDLYDGKVDVVKADDRNQRRRNTSSGSGPRTSEISPRSSKRRRKVASCLLPCSFQASRQLHLSACADLALPGDCLHQSRN